MIGISVLPLSNIERVENAQTLAVFFKLHGANRIDVGELADAQTTIRRDRLRLEREALELIRNSRRG